MPEIYIGNQRVVTEIDTFLSLVESQENVLFTCIDGKLIGGSSQEGNFGLGVRSLFSKAVLGGYVFYDLRKSQNSNLFHQMSLGFDAYTNHFDLTVNGYLPISKSRQAASGPVAKINFPNVSIVCPGSEAPLFGGDGELGWRIQLARKKHCPELRLYAGGYYFTRNGFESLAGPKGRAELAFYDVGLTGSEIQLGIEGFKSDLRSGEVGGFLRWKIPLAPSNYPRRCLNRRTDLSMKRFDRIERLGVVLGTVKGCSGPAFFKGREISTAITLNSNDDIASIIPTLPENALIIVDGDQGDFDITSSVDMTIGQTLIGGGSLISLSNPTCDCGDASLILPGTPGNIVRNDDLGNVINMQANGTVQNLGITGGFLGVAATAAPDVMVLGNRFATLSNAPGGFVAPIAFLAGSDRAIAMNNIIRLDHDALTSDIGIGAFTSTDILIINNEINALASNSTAMSLGGTRTQIINNTLNLSNGTGMFIGIADGLIEGNVVLNAGGNGALRSGGTTNTRIANNFFQSSATTVVHTVYLRSFNSNNIIENNTVEALGASTGITIDGSTNDTVRNNTIRTFGNGTAIFGPAGIFFDSGSVGSVVTGNDIVTIGAFGHGMRVRQTTLDTVSNNHIVTSGSSSRGISVEGLTTNSFYTNNSITTSGLISPGIFITGASSQNLTFSQNTVTALGGNDAAQMTSSISIVFDNNTLSAPGGDGMNMTSVAPILITDNIFTSIGGSVIDRTSTTVSAGSFDNAWDGTGGGSLCSTAGINIGTIFFTDPPAGTCP